MAATTPLVERSYKTAESPWIERVPEDWQELPGRALFKRKEVSNRNLEEARVLSLSYGRIIVKKSDAVGGLTPASYETYQIVEPGDVIIRATDLQNDKTSLRVGLVRDRGIITSAYLCLQGGELLRPEYAYLLLHSLDVRKLIYGLGSGLRQNLSYADFKYLPFAVPPLEEQDSIIRYLAHVESEAARFVKTKRRLIELLQEQRSGVISSLVTRGLDPNPALGDSRLSWLNGIPAHWERFRLKDVAQVQTGLTLGKDYSGKAVHTYPYLRVANVQDGRLDLRAVKEVDVPVAEAERCKLQSGDVLMTEGGDIDKLGRGAVWRGEIDEVLHQNHVFAVRCTPRLEPDYLVAVMGSIHGRAYFQTTAKQTTNLASTNSTTLRAFPLFLPSVDEQKAILARLRDEMAPLDAAIDKARQEIDLISQYRFRLLVDVVTGARDVRVAGSRLDPQMAPELGSLGELGVSDEALLDDATDEPEEQQA